MIFIILFHFVTLSSYILSIIFKYVLHYSLFTDLFAAKDNLVIFSNVFLQLSFPGIVAALVIPKILL